jgi:hypothetical protein
MQVGYGDYHRVIHLIGKAREVYLIVLHHRRPQALDERDHRKHPTGDQG